MGSPRENRGTTSTRARHLPSPQAELVLGSAVALSCAAPTPWSHQKDWLGTSRILNPPKEWKCFSLFSPFVKAQAFAMNGYFESTQSLVCPRGENGQNVEKVFHGSNRSQHPAASSARTERDSCLESELHTNWSAGARRE